MRNFLKTMLVSAVLCASCFAQELNLNVQNQENPKIQFERYNKMKNVGTGLIIGGAVVGTLGLTMYVVNASDAESYNGTYYSQKAYDEAKEKQDAALAKATVWLLVGNVGYGAMVAGFPIRIVGKVKAEYWKSKLPNAYIIPNGANLVWNF